MKTQLELKQKLMEMLAYKSKLEELQKLKELQMKVMQ